MSREDIGMSFQEVYDAFQNDFQRTPQKKNQGLKSKAILTRSGNTNSDSRKSNSKSLKINEEEQDYDWATTASSGKRSQNLGQSEKISDQGSIKKQEEQQSFSYSNSNTFNNQESQEEKLSPYEIQFNSTGNNYFEQLQDSNRAIVPQLPFKFKFESNLENITFKYEQIDSQSQSGGEGSRQAYKNNQEEETSEIEQEKYEQEGDDIKNEELSSSSCEEDEDKENRDPLIECPNNLISPVRQTYLFTPLQSRESDYPGLISQKGIAVVRFKPLLETIYDTNQCQSENQSMNNGSQCDITHFNYNNESNNNENNCNFNSEENNLFIQKQYQNTPSNKQYQQHLLQNYQLPLSLNLNSSNTSAQKRTPLRDITSSSLQSGKKNIQGVKKMLEFSSPTKKMKNSNLDQLLQQQQLLGNQLSSNKKILPAILCR